MDQFVVDVGDDPVEPGERVTIIGREPGDPTLLEWSRWAGCLPHEIITRLGARLERVPTSEVTR
jgi:alanine racemase